MIQNHPFIGGNIIDILSCFIELFLCFIELTLSIAFLLIQLIPSLIDFILACDQRRFIIGYFLPSLINLRLS